MVEKMVVEAMEMEKILMMEVLLVKNIQMVLMMNWTNAES